MDFVGRGVALYGRFLPGSRQRLSEEVRQRGGAVSRDLTRRSTALVIGSQAIALIDIGAVAERMTTARQRNVPVRGERSFGADLAGEPDLAFEASLPLANALASTNLNVDDAELLAAFDLIVVSSGACRFADASVLRAAGDLRGQGRTLGETVRILTQARDHAPLGRRQIVVQPSGEAALKWEDGLTTLDGQGLLPLEGDESSLDGLFESAALAEAHGDLDEAARLYDQCARADRTDGIAPFNYGNIRLAQGAPDAAALAYQQALARDPGFVEARYNLAQALEAAGKPEAAVATLTRILEADETHADALFNLAQLRMKAGELARAKALYERFLALGPGPEWAAKARRAIRYCAALTP
jgi:tetratricopeptide (TPR) repeat protein